MNYLDKVTNIKDEKGNDLIVAMGYPGSGKTSMFKDLPKPMLYVALGNDGGSVVLNQTEGIDVLHLDSDDPKRADSVNIQIKCMGLANELLQNPTKYKSLMLDPYSNIEEELVKYAMAKKGKQLNLDERGSIGNAMSALRDALVRLAQTMTVVLISHVKTKMISENSTGDSVVKIIPKMSETNGNLLLEKANVVAYCCRQPVLGQDGKPKVQFVTYLGAHPFVDTKIRGVTFGEDKGIFIEDCTYTTIKNLLTKTGSVKPAEVKNTNPFGEGD